MPLVVIILAIAAVGVVLWAIDRYLPMDGHVKRFLQFTVIVLLALWLLRITGLLDMLFTIKV